MIFTFIKQLYIQERFRTTPFSSYAFSLPMKIVSKEQQKLFPMPAQSVLSFAPVFTFTQGQLPITVTSKQNINTQSQTHGENKYTKKRTNSNILFFTVTLCCTYHIHTLLADSTVHNPLLLSCGLYRGDGQTDRPLGFVTANISQGHVTMGTDTSNTSKSPQLS